MHELVGACTMCGKAIYCREGFLDGVVLEDKSLVCFECLEPTEPKNRFFVNYPVLGNVSIIGYRE